MIDLLKKLNENKYQRFNSNLSVIDANKYDVDDLSGITVLHKRRIMTYGHYLSVGIFIIYLFKQIK